MYQLKLMLKMFSFSFFHTVFCNEYTILFLHVFVSNVAYRLNNATLKVGDNIDGTTNPVCDTVTMSQINAGQAIELNCNSEGRYLMVQLPDTEMQPLHFCEIKAFDGVCQGKTINILMSENHIIVWREWCKLRFFLFIFVVVVFVCFCFVCLFVFNILYYSGDEKCDPKLSIRAKLRSLEYVSIT